MAEENDWGMKVSLKGYPVETAADHQCLFHSSWPVLKIEAQGSYVAGDSLDDEVMYNHDLGYPPVFLVYTNLPLTESHLNLGNCGVDEDNLVLMDTDGTAAGITFYYYVFRYDLTTDFESTQLSGVSLTPESIDDFGLKISKEGKDVTSDDYRDFVIHSSCRSLQIHKSGYIQSTIENQTIPHGLDYTPMFWGFYKWINPEYDYWRQWVVYRQVAEAVAGKSDDTNLYIYPAGDPDWRYDISYIIFKDPFYLTGE